MKHFIALLMLLFFTAGLAQPGVLIEADSDTVMKVKYLGASANDLTHPALAVEGKAITFIAKSNNVQNAKAVIGRVGSAILPTTYNTTVGVIGAGNIGVWGKGLSVGANAHGWDAGIQASGDYAGYFTGDVYVNGPIYATGSITQGSDLALKENVRPLTKGLKTILALKPKAYEMIPAIAEVAGKGTNFGLIAQDVQPHIPEIVETKEILPRHDDGSVDFKAPRQEILAVNYTALIPVLNNAIQEQQAQIEALQAQLQGN